MRAEVLGAPRVSPSTPSSSRPSTRSTTAARCSCRLPTGSGKTVVADYAVARALAAGRKAFYTTPLKALSNQKFAELAAVYGPDARRAAHRRRLAPGRRRGGRHDHRGAAQHALRPLPGSWPGSGLVVLDEVHYLQDPYRGSVWEEVLILAPPERRASSACRPRCPTPSSSGRGCASVRGPTDVVVESAPARSSCATTWPSPRRGAVGSSSCRCCATASSTPRRSRSTSGWPGLARRPAGLRHSRLAGPRRTRAHRGARRPRHAAGHRLHLQPGRLRRRRRASACRDGLRLTSPDERAEIRRRCEEHTEGLPDDELRVLGYGPWAAGLEAGVASHHAGLIPAFREAVEDCFASGLLRVVFATETLSLGINMPARTVVIERLTKIREHGRSGLTSGEYAQLTGRAGRRGLDSRRPRRGALWSPQVSMPRSRRLATSPAARPALVVPAHLQPGRQPGAALPRPTRPTTSWTARSPSSSTRRHHHALSRRLDRALGAARAPRATSTSSAWRLTARGAVLARIYHESDLLVAEALADGVFDGLDAPGLAAVVSACTFETRPGRGAGRVPSPPKARRGPAGRPSATVAERLRAEEAGGAPAAHPGPDDGLRRCGLALGPGRAPRPRPRAGRARAGRLRAQREAARRPAAPAGGGGAARHRRRGPQAADVAAAWRGGGVGGPACSPTRTVAPDGPGRRRRASAGV